MPHSLPFPMLGRSELGLKTWQLYSLLLLANLIVLWLFNEFILTREAYHSLLSERMEATRVDEYFDFLRSATRWGLAAQPVVLLLQVTFVALLIQMPLVLMFIDISFKSLFRLAVFASFVTPLSGFIRFLWLARLESTEITQNVLNMMPFSLNHLLSPALDSSLAYSTLGKFSVFEGMWCMVIYKGLVATARVKRDTAALLVFVLWTGLLLFQWGLSAYLQEVNS